MKTTDASRINKISNIVILGTAVAYSVVTILLMYSDVSNLPATFLVYTARNTKYAIAFFYLPLATGVLAFSTIVLKLRATSKKLAQRCAQLGLLLSGCHAVWWLAFASGFVPSMALWIPFLSIVFSDRKERTAP